MRLTPLRLLLSASLAAAAAANVPTSFQIGPDLVVATDGTGDFRSIHEAVQSVPRDNRERTIIFVRAGVYPEQVRVDAACITLRGESRHGTRLEFSRASTDRSPGRGQGVLNLSATAHDFVLENFTVSNTHGQPGSHAFAIVGLADRTVLLDSELISLGDDTLAHWRGRAGQQTAVDAATPDGTANVRRADGRFYHARVNVHGDRAHFFHFRREGGIAPWHRDNLASVSVVPRPEPITAAWTVAQWWNPERLDAPRIILLRHQAQPDRLMVTFSEAVTVRGNPRLAFANGDLAEYLGGSGTTTLEFSSPHAAFGGTTPTFELNGGVIFSTEAGERLRLATLKFPEVS